LHRLQSLKQDFPTVAAKLPDQTKLGLTSAVFDRRQENAGLAGPAFALDF
jgi:hypothetical protein